MALRDRHQPGQQPRAAARPSAAAVAQLDRAAAATTGGPTAPGQYFYTEKHEWALGAAQTRGGKSLAQLQETIYETWVPHERSHEWVKVTTVTGKTQWLVGDDELVRREGDGGLRSIPGRTREAGPCGDYPSDNGRLGETTERPSCDQRPGDWYEPTPRFLAGLPTDPAKLYKRLEDDNLGGRADMLPMAAGVLTADAPASVRANLFRALENVPGLHLTSDTVNLDGRHGVGLGITEDGLRHEIVIDPDTGRLIGQRLVLTRPGTEMWAGLPTGTVAEYTAVTTSVVGVVPR
ncbi:CU044_5270 family protein [Actinoplanes sp. NPDC089786]|uniref:CU044_5270 family protein n=1 Tax=Actinoplanes sp. NPDC089786 TaxID=3155185 RepID=UPI00341D0D25